MKFHATSSARRAQGTNETIMASEAEMARDPESDRYAFERDLVEKLAPTFRPYPRGKHVEGTVNP